MLMCDKYGTCCNWKYCDKREDLDEEGCQCSHILEVEEVIHAKWNEIVEDDDFHYLECSHCGYNKPERPFNFCPNCGSRMNLD